MSTHLYMVLNFTFKDKLHFLLNCAVVKVYMYHIIFKIQIHVQIDYNLIFMEENNLFLTTYLHKYIRSITKLFV